MVEFEQGELITLTTGVSNDSDQATSFFLNLELRRNGVVSKITSTQETLTSKTSQGYEIFLSGLAVGTWDARVYLSSSQYGGTIHNDSGWVSGAIVKKEEVIPVVD